MPNEAFYVKLLYNGAHDQFNYVSGLSGSVPAASSTYAAGALNLVAPGSQLALNRNGYLYIWVSNQTQGWDVFFDNLSIQYKQGPVLEENHYYPFGLSMAGISDKAIKTQYAQNKYRYSGKELQNQEFANGTGLEEYDFGARNFDPQIGRFDQVDPKAQKYLEQSTYDFVGNNPILRFDANGMEWDDKSKKEIDKLNKEIDGKIKDINKEIDGVSKSAKDANGNATYNADEQAKVDGLNSRVDDLNAAKHEIKAMGDDPDHIFSLKGKSGIKDGGISADPKDLKKVTITYGKRDVANELHEIKHGFQLTEKYMTLNANGTATPAIRGTGALLEVDAYQRELSYTGSLNFSLSPKAGADPVAVLNNTGLLGTANQINTPFTATKYSDISTELISRMMRSAIGNKKEYPEY
jgi:RHS repeat-associated protein